MTDTIMRVEANVIRVIKSPLNPKVKIAELSCGHDRYIHPPAIAPRKGTPVPCEKCKDEANQRHRAAKESAK